MSTRIRLRRADYTNWHNDNPTLDYGEVGLVFDSISSTNTFVGFKIGDGSTTWRNLLMHRMPTSSTTDGDGLGTDGTGTEGAGESVTTWDQIALLGRAQTFSTVQTFSNQIISTHSADANAIQVNTNKFTVKGNDGDTAIAGTLDVTGATTVTGALTADGGITCDTDKFTVADTTGNTAIKGTLHVNNTTDGDVFTVGANAGSGFTVHGNDGDTSIAGTLNVTGAVTASTLADVTWQAVVSKLTDDGGVISNEGGTDTHYGDQDGSDIAIGGIRTFAHRDWGGGENFTTKNLGLVGATNGSKFLCLVWGFSRSGLSVAVDGPESTIAKIHTIVDGTDATEVVTTRTAMRHGVGTSFWGSGTTEQTGVMGLVIRLS